MGGMSKKSQAMMWLAAKVKGVNTPRSDEVDNAHALAVARVGAGKAPLEVIGMAIAAREARPCRNAEYCSAYARGVLATYLLVGGISEDEFTAAHARLRAAERKE